MIDKTTKMTIDLLLERDPGCDEETRKMVRHILAMGAKGTAQQVLTRKVYTRSEAASMLGRCTRYVDGLCRRGILRRVLVSGQQLACGVRAEDVENFVERAAQ